MSILDDKNIKNGAVWLGAYRRKECPSGKVSSDSICHDEKTFQFTDQHTCKTLIFQDWAANQPTNNAGDDCAVLLASTEASGSNSEASGKAAVKNCLHVQGTTPILSSVGFVCGVKAAQEGGNYGGYGGGDFMVIGAAKPKH